MLASLPLTCVSSSGLSSSSSSDIIVSIEREIGKFTTLPTATTFLAPSMMQDCKCKILKSNTAALINLNRTWFKDIPFLVVLCKLSWYLSQVLTITNDNFNWLLQCFCEFLEHGTIEPGVAGTLDDEQLIPPATALLLPVLKFIIGWRFKMVLYITWYNLFSILTDIIVGLYHLGV